MFGKPHGSFGIPSYPLFRVSFAPATAKSALTFMPLKPHGALATFSSKEAGNSHRRMIIILGKPLGSGALQEMRFVAALLTMLGRCNSFLAAHWSLVCAICFFFKSPCLFAWATKACDKHLQAAFLARHQRRTCLARRMVVLGFLVYFFGCLSHRPLRSLLWRSCHWSPMALPQHFPVKKLATRTAGWFSFLESLWDLANCKWCGWMFFQWF